MMRRRRSQAGLTLLEAVLALAVFSTGVAALFGMISNVSNANRSSSFHRNSLDLFARLSAQIRDAQCDYDGNTVPPVFDPALTDPGLAPTAGFIGVGGPVGGSAITAVGNTTSNAVYFQEYVPPMQAEYQVTLVAPTFPNEPPSLQVDVRIREITFDAAKDAMIAAPWIREYPIQKACAPRYDGQPRGAFF